MDQKKQLSIQQGFTMLELIITLAIISILCTIPLVNLSRSWKEQRLINTTRALETWLEEQRQYATKNNLTCTVTFKPENKRLTSRIVNADQEIIGPCNGSSTNQDGDVFDLRERFGQGHEDLSIQTPPAKSPQESGGVRFSFRGLSQKHQLICNEEGDDDDGRCELRLKLDSLAKEGCLRIISPIGMMRDGYASDGSSPCRYPSAY